MAKLDDKINKMFKTLQLPHLSTWNWLTNHKTKEIEKRKFILEEFL